MLIEQIAEIICETCSGGVCERGRSISKRLQECHELPKWASRIRALITPNGKPPVLSDEEIKQVKADYVNSLGNYGLRPSDMEVYDTDRAIAKAQYDACIPWGLVQRQEGYKQGVEDHHKTCLMDTNIGRREMMEWGDEACPHTLTQIMDGAGVKKRECSVCWQTKLKEYLDG